MHLAPTLPNFPTLSRLVIDCTEICAAAATNVSETEMDKLLDWVRTYPRRDEIHVYLRNSLKHRPVRRLQRTLLSLGCTVTTKSAR
jgi:hypothetical protein